jgi:two-component system nitrogen regulation response regulator GlnG
MEPKALSPEAEEFLYNLPWPGNVRQLENICRWLTVMAAGREVLLSDLPPELRAVHAEKNEMVVGDWQVMLRKWADKALGSGSKDILSTAIPDFEQTMIEAALEYTGGRKKDAAQLLGWGRNTLTRKLQEYNL